MICALFLFLPLAAQDKIVTKEGDVIQAYQVDVGESMIYYRLEDFGAGALQSLRKTDVLMLMRQDGSIFNFYQNKKTKGKELPEDTVVLSVPSKKVKILQTGDLKEEDRAGNAALAGALNEDIRIDVDEKDRAENAGAVWCRLGVRKNSVLRNEDLELSVVAGRLLPADGAVAGFAAGNRETEDVALRAEVRNRGTRTVYLDLGNSFFIRMGEFISFYRGSGTAVPAGATGRVVALAPGATVMLPPQSLFRLEPGDMIAGLSYETSETGHYRLSFRFPEQASEGALRLGEHWSYAESVSPLNFSFAVSYSDTEICAQEETMLAHFYLKDLVGVEPAGTSPKVKISSNAQTVSFMGLCSETEGEPFPRP